MPGALRIARSHFTIPPLIAHWRRGFAQDISVAILSLSVVWLCGCLAIPRPRSLTLRSALKDAREIGQAVTLMYALAHGPLTHISAETTRRRRGGGSCHIGGSKGRLVFKARGMINRVARSALTGKAANAVQMIASRITAMRSTGSTVVDAVILIVFGEVNAELGQFDDAWRCIGEAMTAVETTKEKWCEAEVHRVAGEIALMSPEPDAAKAEAHFERALAVARAQQAKSWELRAAMSLARLWRDQGSHSRPAISSPRSMAGSPKASTRLT